MKVLENSVFAETSLPDLQAATFSFPHMTFSLCTGWWGKMERENMNESLLSPPSYKVTSPIGLGPNPYKLI